jgi:hypothetical protein
VNECLPGHFCPLGSTSATQNACPEGTFRTLAGGVDKDSCSACPAGRYGDTTGSTDATCTGACAAGNIHQSHNNTITRNGNEMIYTPVTAQITITITITTTQSHNQPIPQPKVPTVLLEALRATRSTALRVHTRWLQEPRLPAAYLVPQEDMEARLAWPPLHARMPARRATFAH